MPTHNQVLLRGVNDALLRRQLYVEQAKTWIHAQFDRVVDLVIAELTVAAAMTGATRWSEIPRGQFNRMVSDILAKYDLQTNTYYNSFPALIEAFVRDEIRYTHELISDTVEEERSVPILLWVAMRGTILSANGLSMVETLKTMIRDIRLRLYKDLNRIYASRLPAAEAQRLFTGTRNRSYRDGLASTLKRIGRATVNTLVQAAVQLGRTKVMSLFTDSILGYQWSSVLDGKTTQMCRDLDGKEFEFGKGPVPPGHYNCRSHTLPVFLKSAKFRAATDLTVDTGASYLSWLAEQASDFQDSLFGTARANVLRSGANRSVLDTMNFNSTFSPMTLEALSRTTSRR